MSEFEASIENISAITLNNVPHDQVFAMATKRMELERSLADDYFQRAQRWFRKWSEHILEVDVLHDIGAMSDEEHQKYRDHYAHLKDLFETYEARLTALNRVRNKLSERQRHPDPFARY